MSPKVPASPTAEECRQALGSALEFTVRQALHDSNAEIDAIFEEKVGGIQDPNDFLGPGLTQALAQAEFDVQLQAAVGYSCIVGVFVRQSSTPYAVAVQVRFGISDRLFPATIYISHGHRLFLCQQIGGWGPEKIVELEGIWADGKLPIKLFIEGSYPVRY